MTEDVGDDDGKEGCDRENTVTTEARKDESIIELERVEILKNTSSSCSTNTY